ncbi:MAG: MFS transporter [Acidobacteria bacterium]|nr:MFS transporter [Acidobacteriota bacterium]
MSAPHPQALDYPFVRAFAAGRFCAVAGYQIIAVSVGWQLYERTGQAWALGLVGLFEVAPVLLLMMAAGATADRVPRRFIGMAAHGLLALAAAGLALASSQSAPVWVVYALVVVVGIGRAFAAPAVNTILPQLLPPAVFANLNAWVASTGQLAAIAGPAIGGVIIAVTGGATAAFAAAALAELSFVLLLTRVPAAPAARLGRPRGGIFDGLSFVARQPVFLAAISLDLLAVLFGGAVALLPIFARDILHAGPTGLGWLRAAPAAGALTMALVTTQLSAWERPGRVLLIAVAGFGAAMVGFGLSRSLLFSLCCLFLAGVCDNISVVIRQTLEQVITPDHLRGRVAAVKTLFVSMSNEIGAFESGATAAIFGPVASVVGGGLITVGLVGVVRWGWPVLSRLGPLHTLRPIEENASL